MSRMLEMKTLFLISSIFLLGAVTASGEDWTGFRKDLSHSGSTSDQGPGQDQAPAWTNQLPGYPLTWSFPTVVEIAPGVVRLFIGAGNYMWCIDGNTGCDSPGGRVDALSRTDRALERSHGKTSDDEAEKYTLSGLGER